MENVYRYAFNTTVNKSKNKRLKKIFELDKKIYNLYYNIRKNYILENFGKSEVELLKYIKSKKGVNPIDYKTNLILLNMVRTELKKQNVNADLNFVKTVVNRASFDFKNQYDKIKYGTFDFSLPKKKNNITNFFHYVFADYTTTTLEKTQQYTLLQITINFYNVKFKTKFKLYNKRQQSNLKIKNVRVYYLGANKYRTVLELQDKRNIIENSGKEKAFVDLGAKNIITVATTNYKFAQFTLSDSFFNKQAELRKNGQTIDAETEYKKQITNIIKYFIHFCKQNNIQTIYVNKKLGEIKWKKINDSFTFGIFRFRYFMDKLERVAHKNNLKILHANEYYTSQNSIFGQGSRKDRDTYVLQNGQKIDADINGAISIAKNHNVVLNKIDNNTKYTKFVFTKGRPAKSVHPIFPVAS
jgi:hypothetical protein